MTVFGRAADLLDPPEDPYRDDPVAWVTDRLGEHLWSKQVEITEALRLHRKVAVKACHGPGKSYVAGRIIGHWIDTHPVNTAFAVSTAPTDSQVKAILWREIRRAFRKAAAKAKQDGPPARPLPGKVLDSAEWKIDGQPVAYGRKPADHDEDGFQGIHDRFVLVVLDEACGIPKSLWTATDTLVTNEDARILAIGNPDDPTSEFAAACDGAPEDGTSGMSKDDWWVITISIFDTPNFTGEWVPAELRHYLPSHVWLEERRKKWGEGSPLWISKVTGRFPKDVSTGAIPWSWLKRCQSEEAMGKAGEARVPVHMGVDVAGSELGDETVIWTCEGAHAGRRWSVQSSDPEVVLAKVEEAIRDAEPERVKIDAIGVGWGLMAGIRRSFPTLDLVPVVVSEAAPGADAKRFVNLRAFIWWEVGRRLSQDLAWDLSVVDDDTLNELSSPRYREVNGRVQIESKDDIRKRIGRSTDNADALLLAFYEPPVETVVAPRPYRQRALRGTR